MSAKTDKEISALLQAVRKLYGRLEDVARLLKSLNPRNGEKPEGGNRQKSR